MIALVVADDFTGANDCAGSFAAEGFEAYSARQGWRPASLPEVYVTSLETRFSPPAEARQRCERHWASLASIGRRISFQKIDSTLRGNPGEEILGMLAATGARRIAFCAAYPMHGRQTRDGIVYVRGQRLDKSEYAHDALTPSRASRPLGLFPDGLAGQVKRAKGGALRGAIRASTARVLCFDAHETRDLLAIAKACLAEGIRHFAGASGLSHALAHEMGPGKARKASDLLKKRAVLAGSVSQTTLNQLGFLEKSGLAPWLCLEEPLPRQRLPRFALSSLKQRQQIRRLDSLEDRQAFAEARMDFLVRQGLHLAGTATQHLWLLTGGHCAETFFETLGLRGARVRSELMGGLPLLEADGPQGLKVLATSKPGGFGEEDLLVQFMNFRGKR